MYKNRLTIIFLILFSNICYGEGTKSVSPQANICTALALLPSRNNGSYLHCPTSNRIYFHIKDYNTERFFYGFNWQRYGSGISTIGYIKHGILHYKFYRKIYGKAKNVYILIYAPDGKLAQGPILLPSGGAGYINSYREAITGPNINDSNPHGYKPLFFKPKMNGEYWIEFYLSDNRGRSSLPGNVWAYSPYFDLTVATQTGKKFNGRVHSAKWGLVAINPYNFANVITADASPVFYAMTKDGVVYRITFQKGFEPIDFNVAMTTYGIVNKGNWLEDRISRNNQISPSFDNGFPIFLNLPDSTIYPFAKLPKAPAFANPGVIGCYPGPYLVRFILEKSSDCRLIIHNPSTDTLSDRIIEIPNCQKGLNTYLWDGKDNQGKIVPENANIELYVIDNLGRGNLPIYDAEINKGGFNIDCVAPVQVDHIRIYWDDSQLTPVGTDLDNDQDNLTGPGIDNSLYGAVTPAHAWNGNGNPKQIIPAPALNHNDFDNCQANDFGNVRTINSWFWGISLKALTKTKASCISINGNVSIGAQRLALFLKNHHKNIYVTLIDPTTLKVLSYAKVDSKGNYSLAQCPINGNNMPVILTSQSQAIGFKPTDTLNLVNIDPQSVTRSVTTATKSIYNIDFHLTSINYPISISGIVKNGETAQPYPNATVLIFNKENGLIRVAKTNNNGVFNSSLQLPFNGIIKAFAHNYFSDCVSLKVNPTNKNKIIKISRVLSLLPFQTHIGNIYYDLDRANIRSKARLTLDTVITLLKNNPVKVFIRSYCDSQGSNAYNDALSKHRADSVAQYLISHGINHKQFTSKGYGKHNLIFQEKNEISLTEEQQQANRRSEFRIIKKSNIFNQNSLHKFYDGEELKYKPSMKKWFSGAEGDFSSQLQYNYDVAKESPESPADNTPQKHENVKKESFTLVPSISNHNPMHMKYNVIIGSFASQENAEKLANILKAEGKHPVIVINQDRMYRVILESYNHYTKANQMKLKLQNRFPGTWLLVQGDQ